MYSTRASKNCKKDTGLSPATMKKLTGTLDEIQKLFPGTAACVLLNSRGEVLAQLGEETGLKPELLNTLNNLNAAATKFGVTVNETECAVIHLKGEKHLFSCYNIGENALAFFTSLEALQKNNPSFKGIEQTEEQDAKMAELCLELKLALHDVNLFDAK
ncbi:hypothetical protein QOT17_011683 [Balamuthia mandrillaris]